MVKLNSTIAASLNDTEKVVCLISITMALIGCAGILYLLIK